MVEYEIEKYDDSWGYYWDTETIAMGEKNLSIFSDNEISNYISDVITHEYMHHIMHKYFSPTISKLFDMLEGHFRDMSLLEKMVKYKHGNTWTSYLKEHGTLAFRDYKGITVKDFEIATKICNRGTKKEFIWVEIFGVPRHRKIQGETPEDTIRIYPNHLIIKIEVV